VVLEQLIANPSHLVLLRRAYLCQRQFFYRSCSKCSWTSQRDVADAIAWKQSDRQGANASVCLNVVQIEGADSRLWFWGRESGMQLLHSLLLSKPMPRKCFPPFRQERNYKNIASSSFRRPLQLAYSRSLWIQMSVSRCTGSRRRACSATCIVPTLSFTPMTSIA